MSRWGAVIPTLGRDQDVLELLAAISVSRDGPDQIVVVYQGTQDDYDRYRVAFAARSFDQKLDHLSTLFDDGRGASRGRNLGLRELDADIEWVWWPNDTTRPSAEFLEALRNIIHDAPDDCGAIGFGYRLPSGIRRRGTSDSGRLDGWSIWRPLEPATVWRRAAVVSAGAFDETIGPGSKSMYQACEGTDLLCRMRHEHWYTYMSEIYLSGLGQHRDFRLRARFWKNFAYGAGFGLVARRYLFGARAVASVGTPFLGWLIRRPNDGERLTAIEALALTFGRAFGLALGERGLKVPRVGTRWR